MVFTHYYYNSWRTPVLCIMRQKGVDNSQAYQYSTSLKGGFTPLILEPFSHLLPNETNGMDRYLPENGFPSYRHTQG